MMTAAPDDFVDQLVAVESDASAIHGVTAWWSPRGRRDYRIVKEAADVAGVKPPKETSKKVALVRAVRNVARAHGFKVARRKGNRSILDMEKVEIGENGNKYATQMSVWLDVAGSLTFHGGTDAMHEAMCVRFSFERGSVTGSDVGNWLKALCYRLDGVLMREDGGVHYVPRESKGIATMVKLLDLREALKAIGVRLTCIPVMNSTDVVDDVLDGVSNDATVMLDGIEKDLLDHSEQGKRALRTKQSKVTELRNKIARYAEQFKRPMDAMNQRLADLEGKLRSVMVVSEGALEAAQPAHDAAETRMQLVTGEVAKDPSPPEPTPEEKLAANNRRIAELEAQLAANATAKASALPVAPVPAPAPPVPAPLSQADLLAQRIQEERAALAASEADADARAGDRSADRFALLDLND